MNTTIKTWFPIFSGLIILCYLIAAIIVRIAGSNWPAGIWQGGLFGSIHSIFLGMFFLFLWLVLTIIWFVSAAQKDYGKLSPDDQATVKRVFGKAAKEVIFKLEQRQDMIGATTRFIARVITQ